MIEKKLGREFSHLKRLSDMKDLILTDYPPRELITDSRKVDEDDGQPDFICPVTLDPMDGVKPFVLIWTTGYVISLRALREIGIDSLQQQYGPFLASDVIHLFESDNDDKKRKRPAEEKARINKSRNDDEDI